MADVPYALKRYGFRYGAARVERLWSHKGYVGIGVWTGRKKVDITVTPSGLIRVGRPEKDWHSKQDVTDAE